MLDCRVYTLTRFFRIGGTDVRYKIYIRLLTFSLAATSKKLYIEIQTIYSVLEQFNSSSTHRGVVFGELHGVGISVEQ